LSRKAIVAAALAATLMAASCSEGAAEAPTPSGTASFPRDVAGVTVPQRPERVVSASATHTEIIYALGAGDRVVATDLFSNYPAEAGTTPKIDAFNINVEAVASFDPDLVILAFDPGDVAPGLASLGIPTIVFFVPATLEDAYGEMTTVGEALGLEDEAARLVAQIRQDIEEIVSGVPPGEGDPPTYYHELGTDLYTVTSGTFIGTVYALLGLRNIADEADAGGFGYPQLSPEFILAADPDFIFLADTVCCGESALTVSGRPGWRELSAVREGRVIELDDDIASRWGPRIVEFLETVGSAVYPTVP